jgi:hypothetical protein
MPFPDDGELTPMEQAQNALDPVIESLEARFGERWGPVWLDWAGTPTVNVGLVEPTPDNVAEVVNEVSAAGWLARVIAVRYSERELSAFQDDLQEVVQRAEAGKVPALGLEVRLNKVFVVLHEEDRGLMAELTAAVRSDALVISVQPGFGALAISRKAEPPVIQVGE